MEKQMDNTNLLNPKNTSYDTGIRNNEQHQETELLAEKKTIGKKFSNYLHEKKFPITTTLLLITTLMGIYLKDKFFTNITLNSIKKNCLTDSKNNTSCIDQYNESITNAAVAVNIICLFIFISKLTFYIHLNKERFFNPDDLRIRADNYNNGVQQQRSNEERESVPTGR